MRMNIAAQIMALAGKFFMVLVSISLALNTP